MQFDVTNVFAVDIGFVGNSTNDIAWTAFVLTTHFKAVALHARFNFRAAIASPAFAATLTAIATLWALITIAATVAVIALVVGFNVFELDL